MNNFPETNNPSDSINNTAQLLEILVDAMQEARDPIDFPIQISTTMFWNVDYKNRKHLYLWSPFSIALTFEDYGTTTINAGQWYQADFPAGMHVYSNNASPVYIYGKATDEYIIAPFPFTQTVTISGTPNINIVSPLITPADATTNPSNIVATENFLMGYNGTTWDRLREFQNVLSVATDIYTYTHINTNTTTTIKSGTGAIHDIAINNPGTSWTVTVFDNTAASGTTIAVINASNGPLMTLTYDSRFTTGLTILTAGTTAGDITVSSR